MRRKPPGDISKPEYRALLHLLAATPYIRLTPLENAFYHETHQTPRAGR